jgi:hypothetical protein
MARRPDHVEQTQSAIILAPPGAMVDLRDRLSVRKQPTRDKLAATSHRK